MAQRGRHIAPRLRQISRKWAIPLSLAMLMVWTTVAWASSVDVAVVDVTTPTGSVTLAPGESGAITINISVTGNQAGTATFDVYRDWTLSGGSFTGSNPQEFTVLPRGPQDPATSFSTTGTVTVAAGQSVGDYTLAAGAFDITNSNSTGAKLSAGSASNYRVNVVQPQPPADATPPTITANVDGTLGNNGWYTSDVTVTWTVTDAESAVTSTSGCESATIDSDTAGTTLTCSATSAGGTNTQSVTIMRDATAPTIDGSASPAANGHGWNNTDVNVSFNCDDNLSGIASCGPDQTLSGEGADQSATGTAVDNAGNSTSATVSGINIDKTPPTVDVTGVTATVYTLGDVPTAICTTSDSLSGVATQATLTSIGGPVGLVTVTCSGAEDNAGNLGAPASVTYSVIYDWNGFFRPIDNNGVWNQVKAGSAVPVKFSLNGYQGMSIFALLSPTSSSVACPTSATVDLVEELATASNSGLSYDALADQYNYVWKTERSWTGCRQLKVILDDGTLHTALFKFTK